MCLINSKVAVNFDGEGLRDDKSTAQPFVQEGRQSPELLSLQGSTRENNGYSNQLTKHRRKKEIPMSRS